MIRITYEFELSFFADRRGISQKKLSGELKWIESNTPHSRWSRVMNNAEKFIKSFLLWGFHHHLCWVPSIFFLFIWIKNEMDKILIIFLHYQRVSSIFLIIFCIFVIKDKISVLQHFNCLFNYSAVPLKSCIVHKYG